MPWRQPCPRRQTDKAVPWFSLCCLCPAEKERLWNRNVQAVRMGEGQAVNSTLRSVCALQADVS